ncbi:molybdopterin-dependent oxidoreductase [Actinoplanes sp. NPDC051470]|uniref:molybdopterin-dependent oxidoreductase n=1 Tax=Actinoplanes sp. NPDC051470 TaxID=3157224 RepID=UPI00342964E7
MRRIIPAALLGVLSAAGGVAVGELLAAATRPPAGPLVAVGGAIIDATPTPVKEFAVRQLGTYDKPVLLGSIALVLALFAAGLGVLTLRRRGAGVAGAVLLGVAGAAAAVSRPSAGWFDAVPSLVAAAVAGAVLIAATTRSVQVAQEGKPFLVRVDRRAFLKTAAVIAGGTVAAGGAAGIVERARGGALTESRAAIRLPAPADPAAPRPTGVGAGFMTRNADFYRVDTALTVPRIDPASWRLRLHGMVGRELSLSFTDLLDRPLIERDITLNCVSNEVGGPYIGTARWLGVPLAPLLREAGLDPTADQLVARSAEGMTIGTPVATLLDGRDAMLCVGMNGEPLPLDHGFPVRMLTPGLYGYAGSCKWLTELELTTFADFDAYWVRRGWAAQAPVKTASRIERPLPFAQLKPGPATVAGVAWAQGRGIKAVEVRVDDGPWRPAELLPVPSADTWVQWRLTWTPEPGPHTLAVRATDQTGARQTEARATPFPSGATGWHTISVTAS